MKKIKCAMFSDSFFPYWSGREQVVHNLMKEHIKRIDAQLFCPKIKGKMEGFEDENLPYKVFRCNSISFGNTGYLSLPNKKFKQQVKSFAPNIIHVQTKYGLMNYALKYKKKYNVPVITTMHTNYPLIYKNIKPKFIRNYALKRIVKVLNKCDGIVSVSETLKQEMINLGVKTPITVIKNGINFHNITTDLEEQKSIAFRVGGIYKSNFNLIFAGRLEELKNVLFSLKVVKKLVENKIPIHFTLIGNGKDENLYKDFVEKNNLQNNVTFTGKIDNREILNILFRFADLFLFTSLIESDGLVVSECAYQKTPSIIMKNTPACERIKNNFNGFICENNIDEFVNKLTEIYNNKELLKEVSENAKNTIPKSWEDVAKEYEKYYESVIKHNEKD